MGKFLFLFLLMPTLAFGLTVDTPTSQEIIPAGSDYSLQWTATTATKFNLYASYNNGLTWGKALNSIEKVVGTSFDWSVPMPTKNMTKCKIKVIGYNDAGKKVETGISDAFTINVLNVLYPNGPADNLEAGHIKTVTWETPTPAVVTGTKLSYTINNGLTWLPIATISGNPGAYDWTVPQIARTAKVKVDLKNGSTLVATDTSDAGFKIVITPKTTAGALGTYYATNMEYDYLNTPGTYYTGVHQTILDGAGHLDFTTPYWSDAVKPPPSGVNVPYTVSGDGQIIIYDKRGIISDDGNIVLLADPNKFKARDLDFGMAIKATSGLTNAVLNGTYVMGQIGNGWSGRYTVSLYGDGHGTVHCDDMTGGCVFSDLPFDYTVDPLTGQLSNTFGHQGIVSADGNVFTNVDYDPAGDNQLSISVGIKKSASGLSEATMAGKFLAATFGLSDTHGPWVDIFKVKLNGQGGGTATELYSSLPPLTPPHPVVYSVAADGTLGVGPTGAENQGIVMGNGQGFLMLETTMGHSTMTIGLKTTK